MKRLLRLTPQPPGTCDLAYDEHQVQRMRDGLRVRHVVGFFSARHASRARLKELRRSPATTDYAQAVGP